MAIGARAQSAKTYLEKKFAEFENSNFAISPSYSMGNLFQKIIGSLEELIHHALFALRETTGQQSEGLSATNTAVAVVGVDQKFTVFEDEQVKPHVIKLFLFYYFLFN